MKDFTEEDMPGWKTPDMKQKQDEIAGVFRSKGKIAENINDLRIALGREDSLLDVGCYRGYLYDEIKHPNYVGIDLYPEHIEEASRLHPGVRFVCKDFRRLLLNPGYDVVWCCRVLHHMPDYVENVKRLRSLTRRLLFVVVPVGKEDELTREPTGVYFRHLSEETVREAGECFIRKHGDSIYSTVVYGRG